MSTTSTLSLSSTSSSLSLWDDSQPPKNGKVVKVHTKESYDSWTSSQSGESLSILQNMKLENFSAGQISSLSPSEIHLCGVERLGSLVKLSGECEGGLCLDMSSLTEVETDGQKLRHHVLKFLLDSYKFDAYKGCTADDDDDGGGGGGEGSGGGGDSEENRGRNRPKNDHPPSISLPISLFTEESIAEITNAADSVYLVRDLINRNAGTYDAFSDSSNHVDPKELQLAVERLGSVFKGSTRTTIGNDLLNKDNSKQWGKMNAFGAGCIHAVGQGVVEDNYQPRLMDYFAGDVPESDDSNQSALPLVTLVGKGVTFDTGGLSMKTPAGMLRMKKDMGGAAHVIGLANMILNDKVNPLPIRLRVLIPAVENVVGPNSFRPGDVIRSVNGVTVEVGNTDAEGRLILCDALAIASSGLESDGFISPDLIVDFATLTGAARVALGPTVPAFFCNDEKCAQMLSAASAASCDPVWQLPLVDDYRKLLKSKIANIRNVPEGAAGGGAITAALYLERFIGKEISWIHVDCNGAGKDNQGEAQGMRAMYEFLQRRYNNDDSE